MVFVKEVLESKGYQVWSIASDATIKEALQLLSEKDVGALPVLDGEKLVGVFSERDYTRRMAQMDTCSLDDAVAEIMSKEIYCVDPSTRLSECMDLMTEKRTRHLPVMEKDKVVGIISIGDLLKAITSLQTEKIEDLEKYFYNEQRV